MSNYPAGSMRGSGIYSDEIDFDLTCENCHIESEVIAYVDDWGTISAICPVCEEENDDLGDVNDPADDPANEYEPDRFMD